MKSLIIMASILFYFNASFGQSSKNINGDEKSIVTFEKCIISETVPSEKGIQTKYENDYRVIVWDDQLIKNYKYSNEAFDKLGYEFVEDKDGDNLQWSKVYRNCAKGIVIEVTEWYDTKLSISMEWYSKSVKGQIGYLIYCPSDNTGNSSEKFNKEQNKKNEQEKAIKSKVLNSGYFFSTELSNTSELKISFDSNTSKILYEFYIEFSQTNPIAFKKKWDNFNENKYEGRNPDDYAMFNLTLFFDKKGAFEKITNDDVFVKGEGSKKIDFSDSWFNKLKPLISINKPASISLNGQENFVNSNFHCYFTFQEKENDRKIEFSKNKKDEISILSNGTKENIDLELLSADPNMKTLKKGRYIALVKTIKTTLTLTHFNDYDKRENLKSEIKTDQILSIKPIEN